ncbi:zinc finger MYM-type protein 1-like isoform X1 [Aphis craccivora]|uniref:Zinc finger MYM-type protein 1-like isoform X1 n=1 Tax=Aphis craccivora TaxID=307492 RepID=A0A6G0VJS5_APHCR|nr:zinc finger MYM-type protein 1-like isoform X1 [Aphis craccivora]
MAFQEFEQMMLLQQLEFVELEAVDNHPCRFYQAQNVFEASFNMIYLPIDTEHISNKIQLEILTAKLFSISIDSTFDSSRKEQIVFIVRYANDNSGTVYECLSAIKESDKTTGEVLFKTFEDVMIREGFEWKTNLIGQSYDGAKDNGPH